MPALLSAEMTARGGRDPGLLYRDLTRELRRGLRRSRRRRATPAQKLMLAQLTPERITQTELAGEPIVSVRDRAPGNGAADRRHQGQHANGWFAARPSGTEDIYKIYAESFRGEGELRKILAEAQAIVDDAVAAAR